MKINWDSVLVLSLISLVYGFFLAPYIRMNSIILVPMLVLSFFWSSVYKPIIEKDNTYD